MRFWDSSAVVPLILRQAPSTRTRGLYRSDPVMAVWWGTAIECESAIARLSRAGQLGAAAAATARRRLEILADVWSEVSASDAVRNAARRLLRVHPLRAADALQLAAAVIAAGERSESLPFVCLDERLGEAAVKEGFPLVTGAGPRGASRRR